MNDLDHKVAEARGWRIVDLHKGQKWITKQLWWVDADFRPIEMVRNYYPSTNIAQAMELLEEFPCYQHTKTTDGKHHVRLWIDFYLRPVQGNTLQEAACLAYLKSKVKEAQDEAAD